MTCVFGTPFARSVDQIIIQGPQTALQLNTTAWSNSVEAWPRTHQFGFVSMTFVGALCIGCNTKEKIVDIETPGGEIEIERDKATGNTDIEVTRDR
jgi:hypothetical protein